MVKRHLLEGLEKGKCNYPQDGTFTYRYMYIYIDTVVIDLF